MVQVVCNVLHHGLASEADVTSIIYVTPGLVFTEFSSSSSSLCRKR